MQGALKEMGEFGVSAEMITSLEDALDCNLYFFSEQVTPPVMYLILGCSITILLAVYISLNMIKKKS